MKERVKAMPRAGNGYKSKSVTVPVPMPRAGRRKERGESSGRIKDFLEHLTLKQDCGAYLFNFDESEDSQGIMDKIVGLAMKRGYSEVKREDIGSNGIELHYVYGGVN